MCVGLMMMMVGAKAARHEERRIIHGALGGLYRWEGEQLRGDIR